MEKSRDAFRTISEVAESLGTQPHVLRFWESRFSQVKPVKRAGGRRYYRPADVDLLAGIKKLLHDDGLTIKGVRKVLKERGVKYVAGLVSDAGTTEDEIEDAIIVSFQEPSEPAPEQKDLFSAGGDGSEETLFSSILAGKVKVSAEANADALSAVLGRLRSLHSRLASGQGGF